MNELPYKVVREVKVYINDKNEIISYLLADYLKNEEYAK